MPDSPSLPDRPSLISVQVCEECGGSINVGLCSYGCPYDDTTHQGVERTVRFVAEAEVARLRDALNKPLRETILAVLCTMPSEAAPEHLAAQIESQVRAWQAIPRALDEDLADRPSSPLDTGRDNV